MASRESRLKDFEALAEQPSFWDDGVRAQGVLKESAQLRSFVVPWRAMERRWSDLRAHLDLAAEAQDEAEAAEVRSGAAALAKELHALSFRAKLAGELDRNNAIVSLHAGAGGTESCDWANMLYRMYMRWAESKGFPVELIDLLPGEEAGIKRVSFLVKGEYAYGYMRSELGVHRLVRISPFDSNARRHTSFAACDVLPEIGDDIEVTVNESDLRVDVYRASGAGGQHVNKTESAVRFTHIPTGIVVASQAERSQHKNRAMAMKMLKAKLYELELEKKRSSEEKRYDAKGDIAWGNQIRSYVFMPYQLVKDMRSGHQTSQIDAVMDGALEPFMEAFLDWKLSGDKPRRSGQDDAD